MATQSRFSPLSRLPFSLLALFCGALLLLTSARTPVWAQPSIQRVAVLDFATTQGIDPILGRKAADALAVELQRSGDYEVVTRQELETAVVEQPGLKPPYNSATQSRLANAVRSTSVISGRVVSAQISARRSARVQIEVRQLDAATGDYINGTQISEITDDKLQDTDTEVLVDEALNKAAYAAVRSMKQTNLPQGTVLNVTTNDVELNIGTNRGAAVGQRYSLLRDIENSSKIDRFGNKLVERLKIGEIQIIRVESDQAVARLVAGGQAGIRTSDKVRQIYVPANFPISTSADGGSSTPVTAPARVNRQNASKKYSSGLLGVLLLAGLVGYAGFGGSGSNSPTNSPGTPATIAVRTSPVADQANSAIRVDFRDSLPSIITGSDVAGYAIYRSLAEGFAPSPETLVGFGRGNISTFVDSTLPNPRREITITELNPGGTTGTQSGRLVVNETVGGDGANAITQTDTTLTLVINPNPLIPGNQYFYRVARIVGIRSSTTTGTATTINLQPILSNVSPSSKGGSTAIPTLLLNNDFTSNDLDNFVVTLPSDQVRGNIDRVTVQVSRSQNFTDGQTFSQLFSNPPRNGQGLVVLNLGDIRVPGFEAGEQVFVRILLSASTDGIVAQIASNPLLLSSPAGQNLLSTRFVAPGTVSGRNGGMSIPGGRSNGQARSSVRRGSGRVLRPR